MSLWFKDKKVYKFTKDEELDDYVIDFGEFWKIYFVDTVRNVCEYIKYIEYTNILEYIQR